MRARPQRCGLREPPSLWGSFAFLMSRTDHEVVEFQALSHICPQLTMTPFQVIIRQQLGICFVQVQHLQAKHTAYHLTLFAMLDHEICSKGA